MVNKLLLKESHHPSTLNLHKPMHTEIFLIYDIIDIQTPSVLFVSYSHIQGGGIKGAPLSRSEICSTLISTNTKL